MCASAEYVPVPVATMSARSSASPLVLLFLKAPRAGLVKTRLAQALGPARAVRIYRRLAAAQLRRIPEAWPVEVQYSPRGARTEMRAWLGARAILRLQRGGDLGDRLQAAFARAFARGARQVLAIGGDCPGLDATRLRAAAAALAHADVVLGPARDGGYYLIGLRQPAPELFRDMPWSTVAVCRATRQRARAAGRRVHLLDELEDVDDLASLRRTQQSMAPGKPQ